MPNAVEVRALRLLLRLILVTLLYGGVATAQGAPGIPAHILAAADGAIAHREPASAWSHTLLTNVKTTALGCRLIAGLPLPHAIEVYQLEATIGAAVLQLQVSADGGMTQLCDEGMPRSGMGLLASAYDPHADDDGDSISNDADVCPRVAGVADGERPGCPLPADDDRDGDGVADGVDYCPNQAGASATDGCALLRDIDGDGASDNDDVCARDYGVIRADFALGCPADGSGISTRRRGDDETCRITGAHKAIYESDSESSYIIGVVDATGGDVVFGRKAAGDWFQLERGWVTAAGSRLQGACYNLSLAWAGSGAGTGCYLRPLAETVKVRDAPRGKQVAQIPPEASYAALGRSFAGDWLFFRQGWVSSSALALAGTCEELPVLNPASVASGSVHFCPPEYAGFLRPRIVVGESNARVASHTVPNRLRAEPLITAEQIGEIPPRATMDAVLDGPACDGSFVWWQVSVNGQVGWTVESDLNANYYYLEPVATARIDSTSRNAKASDTRAPADNALSTSFQRISSANLHQLDTIGILPVTDPRLLAWSPRQSRLAVVIADGSTSVYSYPAFDPALNGEAIPADLAATAIAFSPDERYLALGSNDGRVFLLRLSDNALFNGGALPQQHNSSVRALAWSSDGTRLASASGQTNSEIAGAANSLVLWHLGGGTENIDIELQLGYAFPHPLTDLAFSADDRWLAVSGESESKSRGAIWIYDTSTYELAWSKSLVFMNGQGFAEASLDTALGDFVYSHGDSLYHIDVASGRDRRFYHAAGAIMPELAIRAQIIPGAEILVALSSSSFDGSTQLRLFNALNNESPRLSLILDAAAIAFSPDGRLLAAADRQRDRVLILGVTER